MSDSELLFKKILSFVYWLGILFTSLESDCCFELFWFNVRFYVFKNSTDLCLVSIKFPSKIVLLGYNPLEFVCFSLISTYFSQFLLHTDMRTHARTHVHMHKHHALHTRAHAHVCKDLSEYLLSICLLKPLGSYSESCPPRAKEVDFIVKLIS